MNNGLLNRHPQSAARRGFTLIELMVVMGIISLLVAIALPAFSAARKNAKKVTSEATVSVLGTALEQFNADTTVGGDYPPSFQVPNAASPYVTNGNGIRVGGANLLVWALAGADLLGTPGFRDLDHSGDSFGGWTSDCGRGTYGSANPYLYRIGNDGRPAVARSGPYVDMSKVKVARHDTTTNQFTVPSAPAQKLDSQVFLDSFDQPILYYKANQGAPGMVASGQGYVDFNGNLNSGSPDDYAYDTVGQCSPTGIYNLRDNSIFTGPNQSLAGQGMNFGAGGNHPMAYLGQWQGSNWDKTGSFAQHLWNSSITATLRPRRDDSYILISPGPDGLFGTADDVANFPLNK